MEREVASTQQSEHDSREGTARRRSDIEPEPARHPGLELQQQAGNQAMQTLLRSGAIRAKLSISQSGDAEEQEADAMAGRVLRSHAGAEAAACSCGDDEGEMCDECREKAAVARKATGDGARSHAAVGPVLRSPGQPLDRSTRAFFEPRFGRDFSGVRVHTDDASAASARSIQAHAYAAGDHLVFDKGKFEPGTEEGRELLAHELTHVVQREEDGSSTIRRDLDPKLNISMTPDYARGLSDEELKSQIAALADYLDDLEGDDPEWDAIARNLKTLRAEKDRRAGGAAAGGQGQRVQNFQVQMLTPEQFRQMTGGSADQLPERTYIPASAVQAGVPGAGMGMVSPARPPLPVPENSIGIIWEGHHLSDFAVVDGQLSARGFRGPFPVHVASSIERLLGRAGILYDRGGGEFTQMLNTGGKDLGGEALGPMGRATNFLTGGKLGQYRNDWFFPYMPGAKAVYRTDLPPGGAQDFAQSMDQQASKLGEQDYRFSTPSSGNPAYARAFGENACPPGASNCINVPAELHDQALGGRNLVLDKDGNLVDIVTGEPGSQPGLASNMNEYVNQSEEFFAGRDLQVTPTAGPMWARAGAGFIRAGGMILMVYGAYESYKRIDEASPDQRGVVEAEEAGSWAGGFVGNVVGSAIGGALVCSETGPGAFLCALGFGVAGGITGSVIGKDAMHDLATSLQMSPGEFATTSTLMFGTPEEKRSMCEMREIDNPNDDGFDPMCGKL